MACLHSLEYIYLHDDHHTSMRSDYYEDEDTATIPEIYGVVAPANGFVLEPTPIDPSRIVIVKSVPLDSSPLWMIVEDNGFLAALSDVLKSDDHDIILTTSSTVPRTTTMELLPLPSSPKLMLLMTEEDDVELMRRNKKVRGNMVEFCDRAPPEEPLWSGNDHGIQKLRNREVVRMPSSSDRNHHHEEMTNRRSCRSSATTMPTSKRPTNVSSQLLPCAFPPESVCSTFSTLRGQSTRSFHDDSSVTSSTTIFKSNVAENHGQRGDPTAIFRRMNQSRQWYQQYLEMVKFCETYGHCLVPLNWPANPSLAHWVKRQRHQYRAKQERRHSTLTKERQVLLEKLGFVWDSHASVWEERWKELKEFTLQHGHCRVPKNYSANQQLAVWVKCQRRQFKLYSEGKASNMTRTRIDKLASLGFVFTPRKP